MFRTIQPTVWAFDCEWVPDADAGRRLHHLPPDCPEADAFAAMWAAAGATPEQPRPFLKTYLSRVASIAVVERRVGCDGEVSLRLRSLPSNPAQSEPALLRAFFDGMAKRRPQLVGFNSRGSDLYVLVQRGLAHGLCAAGLCARPERPWDGPDYFWHRSEWHLDLMRLLGGRGSTCPSLRELALVAGIPAKVGLRSNPAPTDSPSMPPSGMSGADVVDCWLAGDREIIRHYNEVDAVVTYLLWLRAARLIGLLSSAEFVTEEARVEIMLERRAEGGALHLQAYLERWRVMATNRAPA